MCVLHKGSADLREWVSADCTESDFSVCSTLQQTHACLVTVIGVVKRDARITTRGQVCPPRTYRGAPVMAGRVLLNRARATWAACNQHSSAALPCAWVPWCGPTIICCTACSCDERWCGCCTVFAAADLREWEATGCVIRVVKRDARIATRGQVCPPRIYRGAPVMAGRVLLNRAIATWAACNQHSSAALPCAWVPWCGPTIHTPSPNHNHCVEYASSQQPLHATPTPCQLHARSDRPASRWAMLSGSATSKRRRTTSTCT